MNRPGDSRPGPRALSLHWEVGRKKEPREKQMYLNIPGGLLNTDGIPISVAPGPDWMGVSVGVAAALVVIVLVAMLVRAGWRPGRGRRLKKSRRGLRRLVPVSGV